MGQCERLIKIFSVFKGGYFKVDFLIIFFFYTGSSSAPQIALCLKMLGLNLGLLLIWHTRKQSGALPSTRLDIIHENFVSVIFVGDWSGSWGFRSLQICCGSGSETTSRRNRPQYRLLTSRFAWGFCGWARAALLRIRFHGSVPVTDGSGSDSGTCYFRQWPSRRQQIFFSFKFSTSFS